MIDDWGPQDAKPRRIKINILYRPHHDLLFLSSFFPSSVSVRVLADGSLKNGETNATGKRYAVTSTSFSAAPQPFLKPTLVQHQADMSRIKIQPTETPTCEHHDRSHKSTAKACLYPSKSRNLSICQPTQPGASKRPGDHTP